MKSSDIFFLFSDDLSKRMLNPDMSLNAENSLYTDIQNMYATYLDPEGPEYLHLPEDISIGIRQSKYFFKNPLVISIKVFKMYFLYFLYFLNNLLYTM